MSVAGALALRLFSRLLDMLLVVICFGIDGGTVLGLTGAGSCHLNSWSPPAQDALAAERDGC